MEAIARMLPLCLIIARDPHQGPAFNRQFEAFGFKPYCVESIASAFGLTRQWHFDAVLLDADDFAESVLHHALPDLRQHSNAPILLLSSSSDEQRQIQGLESGATEIVVKPASARLIAAKLRRLLDVAADRHDERPAEVRLGALRLDPRRATALVGEQSLALTTGEFELLLLLASRPGEFVHRDTIARTLRGPGGPAPGDGRRSADMHICRIRKKLRDAGERGLRIETVYGRGYCLRLAEDESESYLAAQRPQWTA